MGSSLRRATHRSADALEASRLKSEWADSNSSAARVHLEVGVFLQRAQRDQRLSIPCGEPFLRAAIGTREPGATKRLHELTVRDPAAQRVAKVKAGLRVQTQIPDTVRG
jgi:hypothetical protein